VIMDTNEKTDRLDGDGHSSQPITIHQVPTRSSSEAGSLPITKTSPEQTTGTVMISHRVPLPVQFRIDDEENPRNWSVRKKCAIACFALLSAFVA
jgi:hypothetical protein